MLNFTLTVIPEVRYPHILTTIINADVAFGEVVRGR
jgi:hypothetical protein